MALRGGIDLGGTKIQAVIVDGEHAVLGSARVPTPPSGGPPAVVTKMADAVREAATDAQVDPGELEGVGVGAPGTIDAGELANAPNLSGWRDPFPLAAVLGAALGCEVTLGNDVQVATDAEFKLGAGRPYRSLLGVFWGTGVGGGLVLDGKPWLGRGSAAEIGHMVVKKGGAHCPCGRYGCLEAYAGRAAMEAKARAEADDGKKTKLFRIMEDRGRDRLTSGVWARAVAADDKLAIHPVNRAVDALGAGIASAVNLLDIEAVVIGGGLGVRFGDEYAERIERAMMPHLFVDNRPPAV